MLLLSNLLPLLPFLGQASAATADEWRSRSVYQIMVDRFAPPNGDSGTPCNPDDRKYCGGTWSTLVSKLDYIQGMGYDAVWISPTGLNIEGFTYYGEAYHGYWITDPTKANPHFGSDDDLKALSAALHDRGMYLMVDIAVYALASNTGDISNAALAADNGGALLFKDQADYHPKCNIKWGDHDSEMKCWLATSGVALMDLDQSNSDVGDTLINWAKDYVQEFGIDGFRIDASKHMTQDFQHRMCTTAGVFCVGEVAGDNTAYASRFQGSSAIDSVFGFGLMYGFVQSFTGGHKMTSLENKIKLAAQSYSDPTVIGQFLDNQDLPRFNSLTSDKSLVYNAIVGCFMYGGIPMIYQGLEQELSDGHDDPYNREALWLYNDFSTSTPSYVNIANVNKIRHALNGDDKFLNSVATVQSVRDQDIALVRGSALIVLTNRGAGGSGSWEISTGFKAGSTVVDLLSCKTFSVAQDTSLSVTWTSGEPFVFVSTDTVSSSGLCASKSTASTSTAAAPSSVAESLTPSASFSDGQGRSTTPSGTGSDPQTLSASFSNGNGQSMTSSDAGSSPQSIAGTAPTIVQGSSPSSTSRLNTAIGAGNAAQPGASSGSPIGGGGGDQPDSDGTNPDIGGTGAGVTQVAFAGHAIASELTDHRTRIDGATVAVVFVSGLVVI